MERCNLFLLNELVHWAELTLSDPSACRKGPGPADIGFFNCQRLPYFIILILSSQWTFYHEPVSVFNARFICADARLSTLNCSGDNKDDPGPWPQFSLGSFRPFRPGLDSDLLDSDSVLWSLSLAAAQVNRLDRIKVVWTSVWYRLRAVH